MDLAAFYQDLPVLVTGGLGFLGSNLAIAAARLGARVQVVDCCLPGGGANHFNLTPVADQVKVQVADMRDREAMAALLPGQAVVFNLAAHTAHWESLRDPFLDTDINCVGNLVFLEACRRQNPGARVIYCGTRAEYGRPARVPVAEEEPLSPTDIYSVNRMAAEHYHRVYHRVHGLHTVCLRVSNSYGPRAQMRHPGFGVLNYFIRLALDDRPITIYGDGSQQRDYLYAEDVTRAFLIAAAAAPPGAVYNVGSGEGAPFIELARLVVALAGSGQVASAPWPAGRQAIDVGDFIADTARIRGELGWRPEVDFAEGLRRTIAYYRQHRGHYWWPEVTGA